MNIAGKIFDIYDDAEMKIASAYKDDLTGLEVTDSSELDKLADNQFALIMKNANRTIRKYPIDSEDSIKISQCYFNGQKKKFHPSIIKTAQDGFNKKANSIDITNIADIKPVTKAWRDYPLHDELHVKTAMEKFAYTTQNMNPREKYAYANAIAKEADVHGVEISGPVTGYCNGEINPISVKIATRIRHDHLFDKELKETLEKIAADPNPEKFLAFDKIANLEGKVPDGYETCYSILKIASDDDRIKAISPEKIEQIFDPEFAKEWATDPVAVYKSLPDPTKAMIDKQANYALAGAAGVGLAGLSFTKGKMKGAKSVIDDQMEMKGWSKSKQRGVLYEKDFMTVVHKGGKFCVLDKDGVEKSSSDSLTKLVIMI